jgi:hypothetical protein
MTRRPPLTFAGGDVLPTHRRADGRARVVYLDRAGRPTAHSAAAWPHELRGVGWHLAEIKRLIAALSLEGAPIPDPTPAPPVRGWLHAHHTFKED